ncbi:MAG: D-aminoacyl-tRNA deacylase [Acidaminococcaceae bacterium]|jgi:D-tyrosyl-tRNA(Tyr) deacylase|nr:D-aminoacyl-tRNA deacylase [Acidaminococcaceae bacterium]MCI2110037.1 D-aminoacyl-tRNA deacylase [Acidaminococcaceae bacterium]
MRAVVQRVLKAGVTVAGEKVGSIEKGYLVLLGVEENDLPEDAQYIAEKMVGLRIFEDKEDKMNLSLLDVGGSMLIVSQFTLLGDCRKGRRPSFVHAAQPDKAEELYQQVVDIVRSRGITVATGRFRTHMEVSLINDGPVTMLIDSKKTF